MAEFTRTETPVGILFAPIAIAASATIVTGVAGRKIVVVAASFVASAAVNVKFQTSTGPIDLTGFYYCIGNGGVVLPENQGGWFATAVGDSLQINLSSGVPIGGCLSYILS